jgi:hypothetical protein
MLDQPVKHERHAPGPVVIVAVKSATLIGLPDPENLFLARYLIEETLSSRCRHERVRRTMRQKHWAPDLSCTFGKRKFRVPLDGLGLIRHSSNPAQLRSNRRVIRIKIF